MSRPREIHKALLERGQSIEFQAFNVNGRYILDLMEDSRRAAIEEVLEILKTNERKPAKLTRLKVAALLDE